MNYLNLQRELIGMNIFQSGFICCILLGFFCSAGSADLTVRFLDVNGGDAVLLDSNSTYLLIDAGPSDSGNLTRLYLQSLNITSLDKVLLTSPDEGKTGAMTNVLNASPAKEMVLGNWNTTSTSYKDILNKVQSDQIPVSTVSHGDSFLFTDNITVDLLTPANNTDEQRSETLIPKISYGNISFLILGDKPGTVEDVQAQIFRVADHGSAQGTDPWILRSIRPEVAVISTGPYSAHLLSPATVSNLENSGSTVYQTDSQGTISITTNGDLYTVEKFRTEPVNTFSIVSAIETRPPV